MPLTRPRSSLRSSIPARKSLNGPGALDNSQKTIQAFTRATKPGLSVEAKAGEQSSSDGLELNSIIAAQDGGQARKRKRLENTPKIVHTKRLKQSNNTDESISAAQPFKTPSKTVPNPQQLSTPEQTPSHSSRITTSTLPTPTSSCPLEKSSLYVTPPTTPYTPRASHSSRENSKKAVPDELYGLIDLFAAFLKSLSLHFAHHGTTSPVDLRNLMPCVSKTWGRRRVVLEDVKRSLGILKALPSTTSAPSRDSEAETNADLLLYDYGSGRICLEKNTAALRKFLARPINEEKLRDIFEANLINLWGRYRQERDPSTFSEPHSTPSTQEISEFVSQLPQAPTPVHSSTKSSTTKTSTLLGQSRLTDLTSFVQKKKKDVPLSIPTPTTPKQKSTAPGAPEVKVQLESRTSSLMSRLKAKSDAQSLADSRQAPPSQADLERKAALERIPEIVATLSLLRNGSAAGDGEPNSRQTYSLPALVQLIRASARGAMSSAEVERCLEVLAEGEGVAGKGFVRIVRIGGGEGIVVGVVVDVGKRLGLVDVRAGVFRLLKAMEEAT